MNSTDSLLALTLAFVEFEVHLVMELAGGSCRIQVERRFAPLRREGAGCEENSCTEAICSDAVVEGMFGFLFCSSVHFVDDRS